MHLVTFSVASEEKIGVHTDSGIVDLRSGAQKYSGFADQSIFSDMRTFLASGDAGMREAKTNRRGDIEEMDR